MLPRIRLQCSAPINQLGAPSVMLAVDVCKQVNRRNEWTNVITVSMVILLSLPHFFRSASLSAHHDTVASRAGGYVLLFARRTAGA